MPCCSCPSGMGPWCSEVLPESPAEATGLRRGDLVVGVADQPVNNPSALLQQVEKAKVGEALPLQVVRGKRELRLSISPAALPRAG